MKIEAALSKRSFCAFASMIAITMTILLAQGCASSATTEIAQTAETIKPVGQMALDAVMLGVRDDRIE